MLRAALLVMVGYLLVSCAPASAPWRLAPVHFNRGL